MSSFRFVNFANEFFDHLDDYDFIAELFKKNGMLENKVNNLTCCIFMEVFAEIGFQEYV